MLSQGAYGDVEKESAGAVEGLRSGSGIDRGRIMPEVHRVGAGIGLGEYAFSSFPGGIGAQGDGVRVIAAGSRRSLFVVVAP